MQFSAEIDHVRTLKKGAKVVFSLDDENADLLMASIQNFRKLPLVVDVRVDEPEQKERIGQITESQRKKIYALLRDIGEHTGNDIEDAKAGMKGLFERGDFSLSNCSSELASEFTEFLISWCLDEGIALTDHPRGFFDDIDNYFKLCIAKKVCAICGKPGEVHHVDAIGMGRNRKKYDDSEHDKLALCREHHTEVGTIGKDAFEDKYHVWGVRE